MSESSPAHPSGEVFEPGYYTLEAVERITRISRERIVLYSKSGLVSPTQTAAEAELVFDDEAIHRLRQIAFLLTEYGINHEGLRMLSALLAEVERLREEVRFLRQK
jgi:DNA-binding transcriptional MerR regulator